MNLIIVESPTKARTLSRFLGKDYIIESTVGHIKDLPKSKLGVDIENNFKPSYLIVDKKQKNIKAVKDAAEKAKNIFIATDPDREGEAIAQHVYEIVTDGKKSKSRNQKLSRIVFHEITKNAVEEAIKSPRDIVRNLVDAQIARRVLDRLVGYKLSPILWKKVRRGLSAGRVQTVTVRLIVERENEIKNFKPQEYWEIFCELKAKSSKLKAEEFTVKLIKIGEKKADVKNKQTADKVVNNLKKFDYRVAQVKKREVRRRAYPPFTTSTMSQAASRLFGWSAKRTMAAAQRLYEEGLITYHRTDSTHLANEAVSKVRSFIKEKYGENYLPQVANFFKTKSKVAQEAHEAIRPTSVRSKSEVQNAKFKKEGELLYSLIWKRFVACQMEASVYDETTIDVVAAENGQWIAKETYLLRASGQIMKFDGWKIVYGGTSDSKSQKTNEENILPEVKADESLKMIKVISEQKFTEPPGAFTEASLIKKLEELGIGRPSTYAPTISTIQIRNYVEKLEGKFHPTHVGEAVNDFLLKYFSTIFDYGFTAKMEDDLDNVANGETEWVSMMRSFYGPFKKILSDVEKNSKRVKIKAEKLGKKCPECKKGELVVRIGRFGKFVSCSRFPDCDFREKYLEKIGMKCPECKEGDVIVKNTKMRRRFFGCSRYPECKWASWQNPLKTPTSGS